jgi:8-oxo-dGTP pyrophosphatase MutT (NUDIX family)
MRLSVSDLTEPIPAATLVLMRPGASAPELLVTERAAGMSFAAGAIVFPGGRVDSDDHLLADRIARGVPHAADRIAAIRETIEEVGVAVGVTGPPDPDLAGQLRQKLKNGQPFSAVVADNGLGLDLDALTPFARWCPAFHRRRFDTKFFLASAPADAPEPLADEAEAVRAYWATAEAVLADARAGRARIIFPTRRNLERIAQFGSIDAARDHVERFPMQLVVPWFEERGGERFLCIPEAIGYPVTAEREDIALRD